MKHWVGRRVIVQRNDDMKTAVEGILKVWDYVQEEIRIIPGDIHIPFRSIARIEPADYTPTLNSIGYRICHSIQFDNAVFFGSRVMVWHGNKLTASQAVLTEHDAETVTLSNGMHLRKDEHVFVVRSLRGRTV